MTTPAPRPGGADNLRGSLLMVAGMFGFAVEDMFLKAASVSLPVGQILMIFGLGGMLAFAALVRLRGQPLLPRAMLHPAVALRAGAEVGGRLFYTLSLAYLPLATTSAILQAAPLVVVAGAAIFFGERVGWRRWLAIAAGFCGVMIILRPGFDGFTPAALLAVGGMLGFSLRDLATRATPAVLSNFQLGMYGFAMVVPTGAALLAVTGGAVMPSAVAGGKLAGAIVFGVAAYWGLTAAMRVGEVSAVTPFRYTRLLFALALAAAVFGERPDAATLIGSAVVVASGLYTLWRSGRK